MSWQISFKQREACHVKRPTIVTWCFPEIQTMSSSRLFVPTELTRWFSHYQKLECLFCVRFYWNKCDTNSKFRSEALDVFVNLSVDAFQTSKVVRSIKKIVKWGFILHNKSSTISVMLEIHTWSSNSKNWPAFNNYCIREKPTFKTLAKIVL